MHRSTTVVIVLMSAIALTAYSCGRTPAPTPPVPPAAPPNRPHVTPAPQTPEHGAPVGLADDATLIRTLREGGYILALRHTHTDMSQKDEQGTNYDDCAKQRNLDAQGRSEARMIGESIRAIRIPVATVLTSPFCRNKETAELAFGAGNYTINPACMGEDDASIKSRAELMGSVPPAGQNIVMITHRHSLAASMGIELDSLVEGGALLIKPKGGSQYDVLHTIHLSDWERLAQTAKTIP